MKRIIQCFAIGTLLVGMTVPAIATGGASDRTQSWDGLDRSPPTAYKMHRPGLRVRLEVRGNEIVPVRAWARRKCSSSFEGGSAFRLEEPGQGIPIRLDGHFEYKSVIGSGFWLLTRLSGQVRAKTIRGFYLERSREGVEGPVCGTGRPGDRALRFVARPK